MFSITFKDAKIVKSVFETVSSIIDEAIVNVDPKNGLNITSMDNSHICLVHLLITPDDFEKFEVKEPVNIGLKLIDIIKILKRCNAKDTLTFEFNDEDNKILIKMLNSSGKKPRKFTLGILDLDSEEINFEKLDEMEFLNTCSLSNNILEDGIKDAVIYSEVLVLSVEKGNLLISAEGPIGDMEYIIEQDELLNSEFNEESTGVFAINYLNKIIKTASIVDNVSIWTRSESPLRIQYQITETSHIIFFLAPRVEEDESIYEDDYKEE